MNTSSDKTLRLVFPQWQGGNNAPYYFESQLLTWLAPAPVGPVEHVEVPRPDRERKRSERKRVSPIKYILTL